MPVIPSTSGEARKGERRGEEGDRCRDVAGHQYSPERVLRRIASENL
jgi:hypothetical protein